MPKILKLSSYIAERITRTKADFRIDTFRSGKNGGQNVNKVESGVRITDIITGLSVRCTDTRDQVQNKSIAFNRLVQKLIEHYRKEEMDQVTKDYNAKGSIRTYKEKNSLVIDSRASKTYNYEEILDGRLDDLLNDIRLEIKKLEKNI